MSLRVTSMRSRSRRVGALAAASARCTCEPLESRRLLAAGDLDLSFSDDGKATINLGGGLTLRRMSRFKRTGRRCS
jgi:hypothetical protein